MSLFQHNTMGLMEAPTEIASTTRKAWDALRDYRLSSVQISDLHREGYLRL